jgi:hypothetical protein
MNDAPPAPPYVTSLEEVIWGGILVAITMAMHGLGMLAVLRVNTRLKWRFAQSRSFVAGIGILILASWMILLVHLVEVVVWAGFFYWKGAFGNASTSYYFSLNQYTTVGSSLGLPLHWRLLEGMIAAAGLLTFAWSTGVLLVLAQEFQDQQMASFKQRRTKTTMADRQASEKPG